MSIDFYAKWNIKSFSNVIVCPCLLLKKITKFSWFFHKINYFHNRGNIIVTIHYFRYSFFFSTDIFNTNIQRITYNLIHIWNNKESLICFIYFKNIIEKNIWWRTMIWNRNAFA